MHEKFPQVKMQYENQIQILLDAFNKRFCGAKIYETKIESIFMNL